MTFNKKISVCLASFNGENYIKQQLDSILNQLKPDDEIIISDDSSIDQTLNIIEQINDPRIKVFKNNRGKGVVKNFENAIINASGDFIFLSDQDDVWREDKVSVVMNFFKNNSDVTCVFTNALIIDKNGESTGKLFFENPPKINLIKMIVKNSFLGCTMAFHSNNRLRILPFPQSLPMHDWFIGLRHIFKGKVAFIDESLIYYRRHGQNVTTGESSNLLNVLKWRFQLLKSLILFKNA